MLLQASNTILKPPKLESPKQVKIFYDKTLFISSSHAESLARCPLWRTACCFRPQGTSIGLGGGHAHLMDQIWRQSFRCYISIIKTPSLLWEAKERRAHVIYILFRNIPKLASADHMQFLNTKYLWTVGLLNYLLTRVKKQTEHLNSRFSFMYVNTMIFIRRECIWNIWVVGWLLPREVWYLEGLCILSAL